MKRRAVLGQGLVAALSMSFAGCSGGDNGTDGNGTGTGGNSGANTPAPTGESGTPRSVESSVEQLQITAIEEQTITDKKLAAELTVENLADDPAPLDQYAFTLVLYNENGNRIDDTYGVSPGYTTAPPPVQPGETGTISYSIEITEESSATIDSYKVLLDCGGVYTPPGCA